MYKHFNKKRHFYHACIIKFIKLFIIFVLYLRMFPAYTNKHMFFNVSLKMALFSRGTNIFISNNRHCLKLISPIRKLVTCTNLPSQFTFCGYFIIRQYSSETDNKHKSKEFLTFDNVIKRRRNQAKRSILIQIREDRCIPYLHKYCSSFGTVKHIYHYQLPDKTDHCLVEFTSEETVNLVLKKAEHFNFNTVIPVKSANLYFRKSTFNTIPSDNNKIPVTYGKQIVKMSQLLKQLKTANSISNQIETCYSCLKLSDIELRLRFHMSHEIERCFIGLFPDIQVMPFGSTVNGFGKTGCDLDMFINLDYLRNVNKESPIIFETKPLHLNKKYQQNTNFLETVGDVLKTFCPGIMNVIKIMNARVPIIKFNNEFTGIQCDLSHSNMSAVYMSELLYLYGEIDDRVRPVVFTLRKWAQLKEITCESPGDHITNFSLTLLIIFYFQHKKILPTLEQLKSTARREDVRITETGIDCTFARNLYKMKNFNSSSYDCCDLLMGFFEFYSSFNYTNYGICLLKGKTQAKNNNSPLFISNPMEPELNVSRNVSYRQIDRIRYYCQEALYTLEIEAKNLSKSSTMKNQIEDWGILKLFQNTNVEKNVKKRNFAPPNVINIMNIRNKSKNVLNDTKVHFGAN
ncbi:poly(A) RNA polymerase, mitochondrial-like [Leptopilina boulardi]|uniref:poly(A) RNA polymerase, mitochondrial-like n=1 Tax=Leptopilina boulardi TaxID=63433 RepID=UPI0021F663F2|nr:poly(A) RNA polymerase, mitochondrial-like [Leptopilina boulardi]